MLVFTRRIGEEVLIGGTIRLHVVSVQGDRVRLGIEAPPSVRVDRQEVHERRHQEPSRSLPPFGQPVDPTRHS